MKYRNSVGHWAINAAAFTVWPDSRSERRAIACIKVLSLPRQTLLLVKQRMFSKLGNLNMLCFSYLSLDVNVVGSSNNWE
eukprot:jgi/Chrzof1/9744/Cz04g14080.t1